MTEKEIVKHVQNKMDTLEGLQALAGLFDPSVMPEPEPRHCVRCRKSYDPRYASVNLCRMEHPYHRVRHEWMGSKRSWDHCERCDKDFNVSGFHYGERNAPEDEGEWCFVGEHTQDEEMVMDEEWEEEE